MLFHINFPLWIFLPNLVTCQFPPARRLSLALWLWPSKEGEGNHRHPLRHMKPTKHIFSTVACVMSQNTITHSGKEKIWKMVNACLKVKKKSLLKWLFVLFVSVFIFVNNVFVGYIYIFLKKFCSKTPRPDFNVYHWTHLRFLLLLVQTNLQG